MADAAVSTPEVAVATPKKRNRPSKKKQKNDSTKSNQQRNNSARNPTDIYPEKFSSTPETSRFGLPLAKEGSKTATPEKKNAWQRSYQQKKKNASTPKTINTANKQSNTGSPQALQSQEDGSNQAEFSPQTRERKHAREEKRYQMELQKRQIEDERRRRWYQYFMSKPNDLITLDRNKVVLLKTVEKGRPQAQFLCKVCNYYCDNMSVVAAHIRKTTHQSQLQDFNDETTLRHLPEMTRDQMLMLNSYLCKVVTAQGMDTTDLETRRTISVLVADLVTSNLKGCTIRLFGSSIHGLGLKASDVNIDLQVPEGSLPPATLKEVASLLVNSLHFTDVVENFDCEFPYISFIYKKSGEKCSISLNNERAVSLAILLSKYTPLDPRLTQLATLFRLWGKLTESDKAQEGTWPGYAFYLMTIFYLQQCSNPVLPVLNDFLTEKGDSESANTSKVLRMNVIDIKEMWKTNNKQNLASLWIGLLRFYTVDFNYTEYIVSIDSSALIPRKTRKIFIVDPFLPTRNVARSIASNALFYYIVGCLMTTCKYFSIPQAKFGPLFGEIHVPAANYHADHEALLFTHNRINSKLIQLLMRLDCNFTLSRVDINESIAEVKQLMHMHDYRNIDNIPVSYLDRTCVPPRHSFREMCVSPNDAKLLVSSFYARLLEYNFTALNCTGGQKVPKICGVCKTEGHLKDDCPEEKLPVLEPLPELTVDALRILDDLCFHIFERWKQSDEDIHMREKICQELQDFIRASHPTTKLDLFGSTKNGFGLKGSDMDICLTFDDNKTGEGLDTRAFIEVLYKLLRTFKGVQDLLPIATAKVPIVKFTHKETRLDGDISLYNVLAMENSKLLCTYANIDVRARILGYMMKRFSKVCHIGDASKGSLSSYAYTLLVIYFLQQCDPPVLPVLQELTESEGQTPKHIVEGCNAYFFRDISRLDKVWAGQGSNRSSVGQLWLNLLIFYTEQFDLLNNVVCIRCSRTVTKFEKLWISKGIAIEDPFDLSHNLGSALTRKMSLYIVKALRKGRNHFGCPVKSPTPVKDIEAYYLNPKELTDGEPPNDRGCRVCKSIGHKERDCPERKKKGRGKQNKKKETTPKHEAPIRKGPLKNNSDDDEDDEDNDNSDSDKGSSDQEEEHQGEPQRRLQNQVSIKPEAVPLYKRAPSSQFTVHSHAKVDPLQKSSSSEIDRQSQGYPIPPGFTVQETNRAPGAQFGPFRTVPSSKMQNHIPKISKIQTPTKHTNAPQPTANQSLDLPSLQAQINNEQQMRIPTIVFSNSKLAVDSVQSPGAQIRYPFPSTPEPPSRPPPGFIPLSQNSQGLSSSVPLHPEQKVVGPSWQFEGAPFFSMGTTTNPNLKLMCKVPMYSHGLPSPASPLVSSGASPRPSVGPAFNNLRFTGMLGPAEQLIWGQSPTPPNQPSPFRPNVTDRSFATDPVHLPVSPVHTLDTSITKMHLNSPPISLMDVAREELKTIRQDFPTKERESSPSHNKIIHQPFPPNGKNVLNNSF